MTIDRQPAAGVIGAILLIVALMCIAWLAVRQSKQEKSSPSAAVGAAAYRNIAGALALEAKNLPVSESRNTTPVSAQSDAPLVWDLCGVGRMPVPAAAAIHAIEGRVGFEHLPAPLGEHALADASAQLRSRLERGSARQRAVAVLLQFGSIQTAADVAAMVSQLVVLARDETDPAVIAWTLSMCDAYDPSACGAALARRWIAAEPGNAAAWIALSKREGSSGDEVDGGLAHATHHKLYFGAVAATLRDAWPPDQAQYLLALTLSQGLNLDSLMAIHHTQTSLAHCRSLGGTGELHHRACDALAHAMVKRGDTLHDHTVGAAIGKRAGWSERRLADVRAEQLALYAQAGRSDLGSDPHPLSCAGLDRLRSWVDRFSQSGQLAGLRGLLDAPR